jgi:hypothetical protein
VAFASLRIVANLGSNRAELPLSATIASAPLQTAGPEENRAFDRRAVTQQLLDLYRKATAARRSDAGGGPASVGEVDRQVQNFRLEPLDSRLRQLFCYAELHTSGPDRIIS